MLATQLLYSTVFSGPVDYGIMYAYGEIGKDKEDTCHR